MEETKFHQFKNTFIQKNPNQNSERLIKINTQYSQYQSQSQRIKTEINQPSLSSRLEKSKTISQSTYYQSPLLRDGQLDQIDKLKRMDKNDFFGQLNSQDPYRYPKKLEELPWNPSKKISQAKVVLPTEQIDKVIPLSKFSSNLTKRVVKDKIHRGIPLKHDVQMLAEWTDLMLEQAVEKNQGQSANMYEDLQQIFTLCLKELIRQISFDCIEKSVLLEKIWNQYIEINQSVYQSVLEQNNTLEKDHLQAVMKTHQAYQSEIDKYLMILKNQKSDMDQIMERLMKLKGNTKYLKKNNRYLNSQIKALKIEIQDLKTENKQYSDQIEKITDDLHEYQRNVQLQYEQFQMSNQYQPKIEYEQGIAKKKIMRAGTQKQLVIHQIPQYQLPEIKPIQRKSFQNIEKQPTQQEKLQKILNDSASFSNIEILLEERATDTDDLNQILQLRKEVEIQTIEKKSLSIQIPKFELRDRRQQIIQTEISYLNKSTKITQTEFTDELLESIKLEEEHLQQLHEAIQQATQQYQQILNQIEKGQQPKLKELYDHLDEFQNTMKENLNKQKEARTNLILVNSTFKDENNRKEEQLQQYQKKVAELERANELANQEMGELEAQLEIYEKINEKIEKKYQKLKSIKTNMVEKSQTLVVQLTQTHKFAEIMKKRIQDKRQSTLGPIQSNQKSRLSNISPLGALIPQSTSQPLISIQPIQSEQLIQLEKKEELLPIPEKTSLKKQSSKKNLIQQPQQQQAMQYRQTQSQNTLELPTLQQDKSFTSQYNISVIEPDDNQFASQRFSSQQPSQQQSEEEASDMQLTPRSKASNQSKPRPTYKIQIPQNQGAKKGSKIQKKGSVMPQQNDQVQFFQETITNFINQNFTSSDSDSDDSEYNIRLEEIKQRKRKIGQTKKSYFSQAPKFQNKQSIDSPGLNMLKNNIVKQLATKFATNQKEITSKMKKSTILKFISQFYGEKLKQTQNKTSLHIICYEYFFNTYGFKNIAEQKLISFYESIFVHRDNIRINLFGRFLQLYSSLSVDDLEIYIKTLKQLDEENQTLDTDKGQFILVEKAIQILDQIHSQIPQEYRNNIISDIKMNYIERNMKPYIDYDYYISRILTGYQIVKKMHMTHYQEVFNSADMDLDNMMEYQEFKKLYYYFESCQGNSIPESIMERQFISRCDLISNNEGERAMSFDRFITFSIEHNLFSEEKFTNFANNVIEEDPIKTIEDLHNNWNNVKARLINRIQYAAEDEIEYFQSIIKKLEQALTNDDKRQSIWISYKIIDSDTRQLYINKLVDSLIPSEFNDIIQFDDYSSEDNN
ncbi:unnamed protein product [Paramecium primaurelia]|uniref:EF-hand domain-containing protein n=1 Tax=Paramecium primaurelia TaxID=5886 RepID=A0A8S1P0F3_PARPR|nr:unnamed protein product [Paramecium primaurelia]